jgi:hypothetical protein
MPCFILTRFVRANRYAPCIRALKSERTRAIHDDGLMAPDALTAIRDVYFHGDMEAAPALAGQSAGLIDKIKSAQQIIEETVAHFSPSRQRGRVAAIGAAFFVTEAAFSPRLALLGSSALLAPSIRRFRRISVVDAARGHVKINLD